ncbi:MAG: hypothetical protein Q7R52_02960 [archaeon]|nr:hypothetical protein [archaeon]
MVMKKLKDHIIVQIENVKNLRQEHHLEWGIFIISGFALFYIYRTNLLDLLKIILSWSFALTGFKLLIDAGIINRFKIVDNK